MLTEVAPDELLTFAQIRRHMNPKRGVEALDRWARTGVKNWRTGQVVRLKVQWIGRTRLTCLNWIEEFVRELSQD